MTHISRETILHLAQLSRLQLTDAEVTTLSTDITNILGYVEQLDELETEGVEPTYQVTGRRNAGRDDVVQQEDGVRDMLLALAPDVRDHQVKVPKVL